MATAAAAAPVKMQDVKDAKKANAGAAAPKKERKSGFSQRARYVGPTSKLTLHVREMDKGKFKVYAILEKPGAEKKDRGMISEFKTQAEAVKHFEELADQCLKGGWKLQSKVSKSSFDAIPAAV
jgi:hypothetical protein